MSPSAPDSDPKLLPGAKRRVFVIEDHGLMCRSMVEAIEREPDLSVCGQADDAAEALSNIAALQPDLVLTDLRLKTSNGLEVIRSLRLSDPVMPILATTMFDVRRNERLARSAGASDFVLKTEGPGRMIAMIRQLLDARRMKERQN